MPGTAKLSTAAYGGTYALSCGSATACSAGGWYNTAAKQGGFVTGMSTAAAAGIGLMPGLPGLPTPSRRTAHPRPARVPAPSALTATRPRMADIRHRWNPQAPR